MGGCWGGIVGVYEATVVFFFFEQKQSGAGILKQSMGDRHRVGIGLSYRPARLQRLAEQIPWIDSWPYRLSRESSCILLYQPSATA